MMNRRKTGLTVILSLLMSAALISAGNVFALQTDTGDQQDPSEAVLMESSDSDAVWNGTDVDVRWYFGHESDAVYKISTPAELAGLAALVNGLVNEDCLVQISDDRTVPAQDWNNPENGYVHEELSEDSGPNGSNLSTSSYHYGIQSFKGKTVRLMNDLDMGGVYNSATDTWSGPMYMPIGGQYLMKKNDSSTKLSASFCGNFDGNGHYVRNLYCDRHCSNGNYGDGQSIGFIGRLGVHDNDDAGLRPTEPSVRNLGVSGYIYGNRSIGGIVGKTGKTTLNSGDDSAGAVISGCINYATVSNTDSKGCAGICGSFWNGGRMENCINAGNISTTYACPTAGLAGSNENSILNSYNIGSVTASNSSYAMAIGTNNGGAPIRVIVNCWYLEGSSAGGGYYTNRKANNDGALTSDEMKAASFADTLGDAFEADTGMINQGYPVLRWQNGANVNSSLEMEVKNYTADADSGSEQAVWTADEDGSGFTVDCQSGACLVAAAGSDGTYTALKAETAIDEDTYYFSMEDVPVSSQLSVVLKGDVNLDGSVDSMDVSAAKAVSLQKVTLNGLNTLLSDVNLDGDQNVDDVTALKDASLQKQSLSW